MALDRSLCQNRIAFEVAHVGSRISIYNFDLQQKTSREMPFTHFRFLRRRLAQVRIWSWNESSWEYSLKAPRILAWQWLIYTVLFKSMPNLKCLTWGQLPDNNAPLDQGILLEWYCKTLHVPFERCPMQGTSLPTEWTCDVLAYHLVYRTERSSLILQNIRSSSPIPYCISQWFSPQGCPRGNTVAYSRERSISLFRCLAFLTNQHKLEIMEPQPLLRIQILKSNYSDDIDHRVIKLDVIENIDRRAFPYNCLSIMECHNKSLEFRWRFFASLELTAINFFAASGKHTHETGS